MPEDTEIDESSDVASENEYDESDLKDDHGDDTMGEQKFKIDGETGNGEVKKKVDPKDPLRPRRKKARRACYACQRAHLTCGDERPCQRCIKRGLAEACQDGVRKKAKYLHDAPPEALRPVLGPTYNPATNGRTSSTLTNNTSTTDTSPPGVPNFYPQVDTSPSYPLPYQSIRHPQIQPSIQDSMSYISQQSPISPNFTSSVHQPPSMQSMSGTMAPSTLDNQTPFTAPMFDPSNPALFNFDLEGLNFGNHYGALEFGMLNHMSSGAAETPPQDKNGSISHASDATFNSANMYSNNMSYGQMYPQDTMISTDFSGIDRQNSSGSLFDMSRNYIPRAYVIEAAPTSLASPSTDNQASPQGSLGFDSSPTTTFNNALGNNMAPHSQPAQSRPSKREPKTVKFPAGSLMNTQKRARDPSSIYSTVNEPYPYTMGFHSLTAYIQRRFSANNTLKIAKSLASIRPSFISCTKTLNRQDLIFMEKCFQRTLFEYEEYMREWGTPTLVCRRTGEVAAVNKEFTLLTGWSKNVLLGKDANLNINTGKSSNPSTANPSGPPSLGNSGRAGLTTPRMRAMTIEKTQDSRPQPVFLAELLDDESVIEFYDDFAKLAFGDSRGSARTRCKLLKYQTKEELLESADVSSKVEHDAHTDRKRKDLNNNNNTAATSMLPARVSKIDGEHGIGRLERDGKLDCAYCWTVKRDVFDIPMCIVMNFLPCV